MYSWIQKSSRTIHWIAHATVFNCIIHQRNHIFSPLVLILPSPFWEVTTTIHWCGRICEWVSVCSTPDVNIMNPQERWIQQISRCNTSIASDISPSDFVPISSPSHLSLTGLSHVSFSEGVFWMPGRGSIENWLSLCGCIHLAVKTRLFLAVEACFQTYWQRPSESCWSSISQYSEKIWLWCFVKANLYAKFWLIFLSWTLSCPYFSKKKGEGRRHLTLLLSAFDILTFFPPFPNIL